MDLLVFAMISAALLLVVAIAQLMKSDQPAAKRDDPDAETPAEAACAGEARRRHHERLRAWPDDHPSKTMMESDDAIIEEQMATARAEAERRAPELAAQQDEWLAEYERRHADDAAGYRFCCKRFGDFLQIQIERPWNAQDFGVAPWRAPPEATFAATVNLAFVTSIAIALGAAPDRKGELRFDVSVPEGAYGLARDILKPHIARWELKAPQMLPPQPACLARVWSSYDQRKKCIVRLGATRKSPPSLAMRRTRRSTTASS